MLWLKSFHLISMVAWFAGLFYLPRLFVYHALEWTDSATAHRYIIMERKLFWLIMTPAGVLTTLFGLAMLIPYWETYIGQWWMLIKLALVGLLILYHLKCGSLLRQFRLEKNTHNSHWYRWFNEIPTILLIAIVMLAVFKQPA